MSGAISFSSISTWLLIVGFAPVFVTSRDLHCLHGVRGEGADVDVCCAASCGKCGGAHCNLRRGGADACCGGNIRSRRRSCAANSAPCLAPPTDKYCETGIRGEGRDFNVCCDVNCGKCGGSGCGDRPGGASACCGGEIRASGFSCAKGSPPCVAPPADIHCATGIRGDPDVCCAAGCGQCGGANCGDRHGGANNCCNGNIRSSGISCAASYPPCIVPPRRRLEPAGHRVLHGSGQSDEEFLGYSNYLPSASRPMFYSRYYNLPKLNSNGAGARFFDDYRRNLDRLGDASHTVLLHIAMHLGNGEGHADLDGINSGRYDLAIDELVRGLPRTGRPVFMRLGYEFNGEWNAYDPVKFKRAWQRIATRLEQHEHTRRQVALVWDMSCNARNTDWDAWYPGDEYVDWWGVNVLDPGSGPSAPNSACVRQFVDSAGSRNFPVMIGESMPEELGTQASNAWEKWFNPYFNELLKHPAVKAFNYINRDCRPGTKANCPKGHWGTARLQDGPHVGKLYAHVLTRKQFVHAGHLEATCEVLNVDCSSHDSIVFM